MVDADVANLLANSAVGAVRRVRRLFSGNPRVAATCDTSTAAREGSDELMGEVPGLFIDMRAGSVSDAHISITVSQSAYLARQNAQLDRVLLFGDYNVSVSVEKAADR